MTITQLLEMPIGKDKSKCGGFELKIKIARKTITHGKKYLQAVAFIDDAGNEMPGDIVLPKYIPLTKNAKIHITVCWIKQGESGKKLWVDQWYPVTMTEEDMCTQRASFSDDFQYGEPLHIVKSKVRMHIFDSMIEAGMKWSNRTEISGEEKQFINNGVEFVLTGE